MTDEALPRIGGLLETTAGEMTQKKAVTPDFARSSTWWNIDDASPSGELVSTRLAEPGTNRAVFRVHWSPIRVDG